MDAGPFLKEIGRRLAEVRLEAVLIGNAAAALQGAPVTTVDFDFLFRKTARNLQKLKSLASADFMGSIHGIRSFAGLRDRARDIDIDGVTLRVAALSDIIRSKKAARRPRDLAVIEILEKALEEAGPRAEETRRPRSRE